MDEKYVIVHVPYHINKSHPSGTYLRPLEMVSAFNEMGFKVDFIHGYGSERKKLINQVKKRIKGGRKYEFIYSESPTEPTLLTEKHHLPVYPFLDFGFFSFCKKRNIPIGLFYRDIYWAFSFFEGRIPWYKREIARLFYLYDVFKYRRLLSVMFLPSEKMKEYLPFDFGLRMSELPPAALEVHEAKQHKLDDSGMVKLFYVGGIGAHYRMHEMFSAVKELQSLKLTFCCRESDWVGFKSEYESLLCDRIKIVHARGEDLKPFLEESDVFMLFVEPSVYWQFAMPLKLFEYLSYGKPIVASEGLAISDFVIKNNVGWSVQYRKESLIELFEKEINNAAIYESKVNNVLRVAPMHTWKARARTVEKELLS